MSVMVLLEKVSPLSAAIRAFLWCTRTSRSVPLRVTVAKAGASSIGKNQFFRWGFRFMAVFGFQRFSFQCFSFYHLGWDKWGVRVWGKCRKTEN